MEIEISLLCSQPGTLSWARWIQRTPTYRLLCFTLVYSS